MSPFSLVIYGEYLQLSATRGPVRKRRLETSKNSLFWAAGEISLMHLNMAIEAIQFILELAVRHVSNSGFSMSINSSVERRGLYWRWWKKEAAELEHHWLNNGRADAHYNQLRVTYQVLNDKHCNKWFPEKLRPLPLPCLKECFCSHHQMGSHPG